MSNDNSLSWNTYIACIKQIKHLSDELQDGWTLHGNTDSESDVFLTKRNKKSFGNIILTFEYHLVYNLSYEVPKLCFIVAKTDGSLLTLEDSLKYLNIEHNDDVLSMLTQMDHPVLQKPFFTLHPCKTADLINAMFKSSRNPVVSWLSIVGATINLYLPNEYAKLTL